MNIKVAAFTVIEKLYNSIVGLRLFGSNFKQFLTNLSALYCTKIEYGMLTFGYGKDGVFGAFIAWCA